MFLLKLLLVILNGAKRSEESLKGSIASQRSRDFSLPMVAQNDIQAKVESLLRLNLKGFNDFIKQRQRFWIYGIGARAVNRGQGINPIIMEK
jgi:hypothetical protein